MISEKFFQGRVDFIENKGQLLNAEKLPIKEILYTSTFKNTHLAFKKNGLSYIFYQLNKSNGKAKLQQMDMKLENCNPNVEVIPDETLNIISNEYFGNFKEEGITDIRHYNKLVYKNYFYKLNFI